MISAILLFVSINSFGQFDDRFYYPSTDYNLEEGIDHEDHFYEIDTVKIHVLELKPTKAVKASLFFFIGAGGNVTTYTYISKPLIEDGYQIFMFEPRGYGKSTGTPTHLDNATDAQYIFEKISARDDVKNTQILIYGASLGTQLATKLTKDNQDVVDALILDGPMSSFTDIALVHTPASQKQIIEQVVTSPYSAKEDIKAIVNIPKLIIYSLEDSSIPYKQSEVIHQNATEPKFKWIFKGEHLEASIQHQDSFVLKINELINEKSIENSDLNSFSIDITIQKLENDEGKIIVELKDSLENLIMRTSQEIDKKESKLRLEGVAAGKYTITYFHDKNGNGEFDTSMVGMPKEPYGFSNNASGRFGPPSIEKRIFVVSEDLEMILYPTSY